MNKLLPAVALSAALMASGCATTNGTGSTGSITPAQVIAEAQAVAQGVCSIAPTAAAITSIIIAENAGAAASEQMATQAANVFCSAITGKVSTKLSVRRGGVVDYGFARIGDRVVHLTGKPAL